MTLLADSGSTKTDWLLTDDKSQIAIHTQGLNPCLMDKEQIIHILTTELLPRLKAVQPIISECRFYGAGCTEERKDIIEQSLRQVLYDYLTHDALFEVGSDLLGAAKALCGNDEGIACILGTGANSCLYDGRHIIEHTPALGFILGDEGSAAYIGKRLIGNCLKGQFSQETCQLFFEETKLDASTIINKVYREPLPNRFLGQTSQFCQQHLDIEEIRSFIIDCFCQFFVRNIQNYHRSDLAVNFVGSIAVVYEQELREAGRRCGLKVGRIIKSPL